MKYFETRFRNHFLNKCGLISLKYLFRNIAPRMAQQLEPSSVLVNYRAQDGTTVGAKLGSG